MDPGEVLGNLDTIALIAARVEEAVEIKFPPEQTCRILTEGWDYELLPEFFTEAAKAMEAARTSQLSRLQVASWPFPEEGLKLGTEFRGLRNLELSGCTVWYGPSDLLVYLHQMPELQDLSLTGITFRDKEFDLQQISPRVIMSRLTTIKLADTWEMMNWLLSHLDTPNLTHRSISIQLRSDYIDDKKFREFLTTVHKLEDGIDVLPMVNVYPVQDKNGSARQHTCDMHILPGWELKGEGRTVETKLFWDIPATELEANQLQFEYVLAVVLLSFKPYGFQNINIINPDMNFSTDECRRHVETLGGNPEYFFPVPATPRLSRCATPTQQTYMDDCAIPALYASGSEILGDGGQAMSSHTGGMREVGENFPDIENR
ncbi:hypothetical protein FA95DRAFT_1576567 [Auriscalpium vulgare]|uniref:Uncharacterized protein n=1 Tax=Auriscalpium vulgare TaxID=40419 RepID=A0ACB8RAN2_9AGAM|nr:hypothetical protein FA95DRAFT_1576567 [Auriscalpium vulgare]